MSFFAQKISISAILIINDNYIYWLYFYNSYFVKHDKQKNADRSVKKKKKKLNDPLSLVLPIKSQCFSFQLPGILCGILCPHWSFCHRRRTPSQCVGILGTLCYYIFYSESSAVSAQFLVLSSWALFFINLCHTSISHINLFSSSGPFVLFWLSI